MMEGTHSWIRPNLLIWAHYTEIYAFNIATWRIREGSTRLFAWLALTWTKSWPTLSEVEMLDLTWFTSSTEEGIQRLKEIGMLEWIYHLRTTYPPWESPENKSSNITVRN